MEIIFKDEFPGPKRGKGDRTRVSPVKDGVGVSASRETKSVNFSLFLRPAVVKASGGRCGFVREASDVAKETGTTRRTCCPDEKVESNFLDEEVKNVLRDAEASKHTCPDERILGLTSTLALTMEEKRMRCPGRACDLKVPALSACSQGPSNDPKVTLKRKYEDCCQSSSQSDSDSEDSERMERSSRPKERRISVRNSSSERGRRGRVNKKLRALQELLPNCDEVDQVAVLDEAIEYLKRLQQQFLVLSTGSPMYVSPPMMLPAGIQQVYAPYLNQFTAVNLPRGMNVGVGCGRPQFPISHGPRNGMRMLGLQSLARIPPFIPSFGQSLALSSSTQAPSMDTLGHLDSAAQSGLNDFA